MNSTRACRWTRVGAVCATRGPMLFLLACTGVIAPGPSERETDGLPEGPADEATDREVEGRSPGDYEIARPGCEQPEPGSDAFLRLTGPQYANTTRDLLYLDDARVEPYRDLGTARSVELPVDVGVAEGYLEAAEALALAAVSDSHAYDRLVPCEESAPDCAAQFVSEFGARALRRPLTEEESEALTMLHAQGGELYEGGDTFRNGVRLVVETLLQMPDFLYRSELSQDEDGDGLVVLDEYEVASRLSYALWDSMPDDRLFALANDGTLLDEGVVAEEGSRMLNDPRAAGVLRSLHDRWLGTATYHDVQRDTELFPAFSGVTFEDLQGEVHALVDHVIESGGGIEMLLGGDVAFVNEALAPVYGIDVRGDDFQAMRIPGRRGLLTQIGFLASHAHGGDPSPILRGAFIQRKVLCNTLPDPPDDVDTSLPELTEDMTNRERVEAGTGTSPCSSCHSLINPPGFALEAFDAIGAHRTSDNGQPVDTTGSIRIDGAEASFQGPEELLEHVSTSDQAAQCYVRQWLEHVYRRETEGADRCTSQELGAELAEGASIVEVLGAVVETRTFRTRGLTEGE